MTDISLYYSGFSPENRLLFSKRLKSLYADMDRYYQAAADYYGFHCSGCKDNCCLTRFYHHTFSEYFYLSEGYDRLSPEDQASVKQRAVQVCEQTACADIQGLALRLMCPLNSEGLCLLYAYRPMICRLHGISHEFRKPGGTTVYGPGCGEFGRLAIGKAYFKFDRTRFYFEMAGLERELKQSLGVKEKLKMTVAEMFASGISAPSHGNSTRG